MKYHAPPFELSSAPCVFTKVMVVHIAHLHLQGMAVYPYLDDLPSESSIRGQRMWLTRYNVSLIMALWSIERRTPSSLTDNQSPRGGYQHKKLHSVSLSGEAGQDPIADCPGSPVINLCCPSFGFASGNANILPGCCTMGTIQGTGPSAPPPDVSRYHSFGKELEDQIGYSIKDQSQMVVSATQSLGGPIQILDCTLIFTNESLHCWQSTQRAEWSRASGHPRTINFLEFWAITLVLQAFMSQQKEVNMLV